MAENENDLCGRYFPSDRNDFVDSTGCILPDNKCEGLHRCVDNKGNIVEWEYDFDCDCDDCHTDSFNDMCIIYQIIH